MDEAGSRDAARDDRRSRRTRRTLMDALVALMLEKRYDSITVQEIIDRANVGRSTFYAHYQDKEDLLQSSIAEMIGGLNHHMDAHAAGRRIIPSLELLYHLRDSQGLYRALVRGRAVEAVLKAMQTHLSRHVESRLAQRLPPGATPSVPLPVIAQHMAGALLTLYQWWLDHDLLESPEQVDEYFLQLVRPGVQAGMGVEI
jgi:AcrR family transcriptional regulator